MTDLPVSLCHWGAFEATVHEGRLIRTTPWPGSGASAAMISALPELVYSDKRVLCPHVRKSWLDHGHRASGSLRGQEEMVPVEWETALTLVSRELIRVRDEYSHQALFAGSYGWSSAGRFHHARTQIRRFFGAFGGFTDQVGNYSWGAAEVILEEVLGTCDAVRSSTTAWNSIISNTDTFVAFGGLNPKNWNVTSGGAGHHHMPQHARAAAQSGTRFVIISPVADDIPDGIDADWIAPRPGSDVAIMLALAQEMVRRGRADHVFLDRYTTGAKPFLDYLDGSSDGCEKTLEWAANLADVPVASLQKLADQITNGRVMLSAAWSLQRAQHGEMPYWALIALAAVLGQIGLPGGGFGFGYGSLNAVGHGATKGLIPSLPLLGNPRGTHIPVARISDMLASPGSVIPFRGNKIRLPEVKLIYWAGGNPFHHAQDLVRLEQLWQRPETIIVHEQFWTATAQRADIVLPASTSLERNDIGGSSRDRHVFYMPKLIDPVGQAQADYNIFSDLANRLGIFDMFTQGLNEEQWLRELWSYSMAKANDLAIKAPGFEQLRTMNVWPVPVQEKPEILMEDYRRDPKHAPLPTPSGRIELTSERIRGYALDDVPPHAKWMPPDSWLGSAQDGAFALLSRQPKVFLHSQLGQTSLATEPEISVHPAEAEDRGLSEGIQVRVHSHSGACLAILRCSGQIRRGVAIMETGPWFIGGGDTDLGGNPNALTSDIPTSTLSQATAAQSCLVWIDAAKHN